MARYKVVDNVRMQLTAEEEAQLDADADANDLNLDSVRQQRNGMLGSTDWTQIGDATLGDHTAEEWRTYRQALRDLPSTTDRVSLIEWPNDPPTQAAIDAAAE